MTYFSVCSHLMMHLLHNRLIIIPFGSTVFCLLSLPSTHALPFHFDPVSHPDTSPINTQATLVLCQRGAQGLSRPSQAKFARSFSADSNRGTPIFIIFILHMLAVFLPSRYDRAYSLRDCSTKEL